MGARLRRGEFVFDFAPDTNARRDALCGDYEHADGSAYFQVSVRAVSENGKANIAVIAFLAKTPSIAKSGFKLKSGSKSRFKCIAFNLPAEFERRGT